MIRVQVMEIAGIVPSLQAMRLPKGSESQTHDESTAMRVWHELSANRHEIEHEVYLHVDDRDLELAQRLIKAGDEHAKAMRGIMVWLDIEAPIYWWRELETYRAGHERLSCESTMHQDCRGLQGEELRKAKAEMPMGHMQRAIDVFSVQTLRRIWLQRRTHRLPEWQGFITQLWERIPAFLHKFIFVESDKY